MSFGWKFLHSLVLFLGAFVVLRGVVGSIGAILDGNLIGSVLAAGLSLFIGIPMVSGAWIRLRRQGPLEASPGQHRSLS